jgi:hypothetical protein
LVGSRVFLESSPVPRHAMTVMVNLDMVGRLRHDRLFVEGARERATRALIDGALSAVGIHGDHVESEGRSDHATFLAARIEAISLSTGYHEDYHTASDVASRVNLAGIERVVDAAERIVRQLADR